MSYDENYKPLPKLTLVFLCVLAFFATFFMVELFQFSKFLSLSISSLISLIIYLIHRD